MSEVFLIKRSVYIFDNFTFAIVYFYYLNPIIIEQEQKKYRLQNWQFQISVCKDEIKSLSQEIKELELIEKIQAVYLSVMKNSSLFMPI